MNRFTVLLWKIRTWFEDLPSARQSVLLGVITIVMLIGFVQCVKAEPAGPDTNYQAVLAPNGGAAFCPLQNGVPVSGVIALCLLGQTVAPNLWAIDGSSMYCVITGIKESKPFWTCGSYEEVKGLTTSI